MKFYYTTILFISFCFNGFSQTNNDPAAKKVLDQVSSKFKTFKTVKATFTYKVENASGKVLSSKNGTVQMKGIKYRISIVGQEIFCDGNNVWTYDQAANEVTITEFEGENNSITPQKLFTNFYDQDYYYKLNGEKKLGSKTVREIEMTPIDKSKLFFKVYVYIDKTGNTVTSTKVLEKAGSVYNYTVNSFTPNSAIADNTFVFDVKKYPGVEVIDLR